MPYLCSVPLHVTPSFSTEKVTLKWRLHFEFVTTNKAINWKADELSNGEWQPPRALGIETMVWDFPITIYSAAPTHISKALYGARDAKIQL